MRERVLESSFLVVVAAVASRPASPPPSPPAAPAYRPTLLYSRLFRSLDYYFRPTRATFDSIMATRATTRAATTLRRYRRRILHLHNSANRLYRLVTIIRSVPVRLHCITSCDMLVSNWLPIHFFRSSETFSRLRYEYHYRKLSTCQEIRHYVSNNRSSEGIARVAGGALVPLNFCKNAYDPKTISRHLSRITQ